MLNHPQNGQMNIMGALGGAPARPDRPQMDHAAFQALSGDARQAFRQDFQGQMMDYRGAMNDWRTQVHGLRHPGQQIPGNTGIVPPGVQTNPGMPVAPVAPQILPPANMVGSSYAVQGMNPATSPYGLPTY